MSVFDLEDFDSRATPRVDGPLPKSSAAVSAEEIESARATGYEEGYRTGWDDAARAADEESRAVSAELARNLRDMTFTYFEAREELLQALRPFLAELLSTLFPALLPQAAGAAIAEDLGDQVKAGCDGAFRVLVSPEDAEVVRALMKGVDAASVTVAEEPALASGQARLISTRREIAIDADAILERLRAALGGLAEGEAVGVEEGEEGERRTEALARHG